MKAILFRALVFGAFVAPSLLLSNTAVEPVPRDAEWLKRHAGFLAQAKEKDAAVIFLGDSITDNWRTAAPLGGRAVWEKQMAPLGALNLGISGDRTQHVLWRIANGELDGMHPKVVVLMIGTNNTGFERGTSTIRNTVEDTIDGVRAVTKALTAKLPDTKILVLGIFPRGATLDDPQRLQVDAINAALTDLHDGKQVYFWNIGGAFLGPDGALSSGMMPDYLHPCEVGYQIWADAIRLPLETLLAGGTLRPGFTPSPTNAIQTIRIESSGRTDRFDGIGVVNGGGATAVLLKDYPDTERSQILDLLYKPKFGASVSALLVEIPGDGNSTQGSMPSHMHRRDDLDYWRGYTWWIMQEAKKRNPALSLDATAWSAPGWVGEGTFWSKDTADYYVKWLQGLRQDHHLELDAIGCRNEKGNSYDFAKQLRATLNANGFEKVKLHGFDNWPADKLNFVNDMTKDPALRDAIDVISAHIFWERTPASAKVQEQAAAMAKPIWNTEEHVYRKGFDCAISLVQAFNLNYIRSSATKVVTWYDIASLYPIEPYSEDPAALLAHTPWSGNYSARDVLWGYAHYGQFTEIGWHYLKGACGELAGSGSYVTLKSPQNDFSIIIETKEARALQQVRFVIGEGLAAKELCVWRSNPQELFIQQPKIVPVNGSFTLTLDPGAIYSISTTTGQQKGSFPVPPADKPFPFPYADDFERYVPARDFGYLPSYTADIAGAFELVARPDGRGQCLQQVVPTATISWAPDWLPYTIIGDLKWEDFEISADISLNPGDAAGLMGRVNHVGTGYGFIPKGYYFELREDGRCQLVVVSGKPDKKKLVGDAEQQALIKKSDDAGEGGEKILAEVKLPDIRPGQWHHLALRFEGSTISGLVDQKVVLTATNSLYSHGMAGLIAGHRQAPLLSTPYYDNLVIKAVGAPPPAPLTGAPNQTPIYRNPANPAHKP